MAGLNKSVDGINALQKKEESSASGAGQAAALKDVAEKRRQELGLIARANQLTKEGRYAEAEAAMALAGRLRLERELTEEKHNQAAVTAAAPAKPGVLGKVATAWSGDSIAGALGQFLPSLSTFGPAAIAASMVSAFVSAINKAKEIKEFSTQLNVTAGDFKQINRAAHESGNSVMTYGMTLTMLAQARRAASAGNEDMRATFARFGITLNDLQNPGLKTLDLLKRIGQQTANMSEPDRAALHDILGRGSDRVAGSLAGITGQADPELENATERLSTLGRNWDKVMGAISDRTMRTVATVVEMIQDMGDAVVEAFDKIGLAGPGGQGRAPGKSQEQKDLDAWRLDKAAIDRGDMVPEQASEGYIRREQYNQAFTEAATRGQRLRYQTFLDNQQHNNDIATSGAPGAAGGAAVQANNLADAALGRQQAANARAQQAIGQGNLTAAGLALVSQAEERLALEKQIAELQTKYKTTSDPEDKQRLKGEIIALQSKTAEMDKSTTAQELANAEKRRELELALMGPMAQREASLKRLRDIEELMAKARKEGNRDDLGKLDAQKLAEQEKLKKAELQLQPTVNVSALQRIGGFTGGLGGNDPTRALSQGLSLYASGNRALGESILRKLNEGVVIQFS